MTKNEQLALDGYAAVMRGELEALDHLMAPDLDWHWWEHGPWDCHSRAEAIAVIRERIGQRAVGELVEATEIARDRGVVVTRMRPYSEIGPEDLGLSPDHLETANLVTFRGGKVVAMHAYRTRADAVEVIEEAEHGGQ